MRITVAGLYDGPLPPSVAQRVETACGGDIPLPPGAEVTLDVRFVSGGEACAFIEYAPESVSSPAYTWDGQDDFGTFSSSGCSGQAQFELVPLAVGASFYAGAEQDGGVPWLLQIDIVVGPNGGACGFNGTCTNLYVGSSQKL
ncbi:MAG TPA: hypothetical protein VE987_19210 [Polyangiaceae bacterium]|nr:hypothetical protein [Polyangiaceae bacterium]